LLSSVRRLRLVRLLEVWSRIIEGHARGALQVGGS